MIGEQVDVLVVGGGPAGSTAACDLARKGHSVLLLDRDGRVKPCGGAVPPQLMTEFDVPGSLLVNRVIARAWCHRWVAPSTSRSRTATSAWSIARCSTSGCAARRGRGAGRRTGIFTGLTTNADGSATVTYRDGNSRSDRTVQVRARMVVGADGALSAVARTAIPCAKDARFVFAYHEIVESPASWNTDEQSRCDVYYDGGLSPDFYSWVFPHGATTSIGTGSMIKGFDMRGAVSRLRERTGLTGVSTMRREGAPIPLVPLKRWDNGRNVVLAGDASGVVAPASGEGIYYAMAGGRAAADAIDAALEQGDARQLANARRAFMRQHGQVFRVLSIMQRYWYSTDGRRERFVAICRDRDVQRLTFEGYMHKRLVRAEPLVHLRIFLKNIGHLSGLVPV